MKREDAEGSGEKIRAAIFLQVKRDFDWHRRVENDIIARIRRDKRKEKSYV